VGTCRNSASQKTDFVELRSRIDFGDASLVHGGVLAENGDAEEMVDRLPVLHPGEPRGGFVGRHQPTAPVEHERVADVGFAGLAFVAFGALALPHGNAFVTRLDVPDLSSNALANPAEFTPRPGWVGGCWNI